MLVREGGARRVGDPQASGSQFRAGNEAIFRFECFFIFLGGLPLAGWGWQGEMREDRSPFTASR